ncbi:MAG: hypothetical protein PF542_03480 [Nanoarchaeota archaeon]|jgi:hypothetical protein|nr:hypothetical protein [Nanoarchaeota archaeon]
MAGEEFLLNATSPELIAGGLAFVGIMIFFISMIIIAFYVYTALAWQTIAKKSGYKRPWLAWIPLANIAMILELGGFHWAWVFLAATIVIPFVGIIGVLALVVLSIIAHWRIFEKIGYPGWLAILSLINIAYLIIIGIVAWEKKTYKKATVAKKPTKKKVTSKKKK